MNTETVPTLSVSDTTPGKNHIFCRYCQHYAEGSPGIRRALCGDIAPSEGRLLRWNEPPGPNPCGPCVEKRYCDCVEKV
jgi:hypothetical protein